jgi:hypothetical protein
MFEGELKPRDQRWKGTSVLHYVIVFPVDWQTKVKIMVLLKDSAGIRARSSTAVRVVFTVLKSLRWAGDETMTQAKPVYFPTR